LITRWYHAQFTLAASLLLLSVSKPSQASPVPLEITPGILRMTVLHAPGTQMLPQPSCGGVA